MVFGFKDKLIFSYDRNNQYLNMFENAFMNLDLSPI